ncbi:MAG: ParB family transcriptional regulator, chromosome partitioning protein [Gaiellales bacterium]|nr:ParB family transcriptional regulator, chromosome partitioning protein [Gaiellales bacterium]
MAKNRGLGRGLAALVAEFPAGQVSLIELEITQVKPNPRQPRTHFDDDAIAALAESIKSEGVVQPIIVRDAGEGYQIVAGERRWRAAQRAGLTTIPAIVRPIDERESLIMALAENVAREDLNPVEQGRAYAVLADELDLSQTEIARRVGKSRPAVANTMRLLELPDEVLDMIASAALSEGHGRALLLAGGQDERIALARTVAKRGLSVRETEAAAKRIGKPKAVKRPATGWVDEELAHLAVDAAWQSLRLRASVRSGPRGGSVELRFSSPAELGRIIDQLRAERVSWAE